LFYGLCIEVISNDEIERKIDSTSESLESVEDFSNL